MAQGIKTGNGTIGATVCFEGEKRLVRQLKRLHKEAPKVMKALHRAAADSLVAPVRARVPHGHDRKGHKRPPGALARSVRAGSTATSAYVRVGGAAGVKYAGVIVFGNAGHNIEATHFPYHALDAERPRLVAMHAVGINRAVNEIITRSGPDV